MRIGERLALDQLHDQDAACRPDVLETVDVRDVRMVERREQLRLALEARQALGIGGERCRAGP